MVQVAFCEDCNVIHDVTYQGRLDPAYLSLVAWHSERRHGHVVKGKDVAEIEVDFLTPIFYRILGPILPGYVIGQIEKNEIDIT
ncbi:hypothetical protein KBD75_01880 [Candidatus Woesebacteria bacterium]|nr:hypothetical protein [Candidatus Woesebacteria bacterium]